MPRNNSGVMEQVPNTRGGPPLTPIGSAKYNAVVDDFITEMNSARPVTAGGTGRDNLADFKTDLGLTGPAVIADKPSQEVSAGIAFVDLLDHETKATGTLTIEPHKASWQKVTCGGAFVLAVDLTKVAECCLMVTNNGSAGAIDITAFGANVDGDVHALGNGEVYAFYITVFPGGWPALSIRKKAA